MRNTLGIIWSRRADPYRFLLGSSIAIEGWIWEGRMKESTDSEEMETCAVWQLSLLSCLGLFGNLQLQHIS